MSGSRTAGQGVLAALVQAVIVTSDRTAAIKELSGRIAGASAEDIARTPFALIGSHEEMARQLVTQAESPGITSYVVREPAVPDLERVLARGFKTVNDLDQARPTPQTNC